MEETKEKLKFDLPIPVNGQILVEEIDYENVDNGSKSSSIIMLKKEQGVAPDPTIGKVLSLPSVLPETAKEIKIGDILMINPFSDRRVRIHGKYYLLIQGQTDVYAILPVSKKEEEAPIQIAKI